MSFQSIVIEGNLGKDPELKGDGDKTRATFTVAVNEKSGGEEHVEWFNVVCFGKTAENAAKYLSKGRGALVQGRLQTRQYEKDGQTRYFTELRADRVVFIGGAPVPDRKSETGGARSQPATVPSGGGFVDDDLPF